MAAGAPLRGQVVEADLPGVGRKLWLVVSNNQRNAILDDVVVVRLTTTAKPRLPTIVELSPADAPLAGRVLCDDIGPIYRSDIVGRPKGALTPVTMRRVDDALKAALALR